MIKITRDDKELSISKECTTTKVMRGDKAHEFYQYHIRLSYDGHTVSIPTHLWHLTIETVKALEY